MRPEIQPALDVLANRPEPLSDNERGTELRREIIPALRETLRYLEAEHRYLRQRGRLANTPGGGNVEAIDRA